MAWWGWLLVGWTVAAVLLALWLGAVAGAIKRAERSSSDDEPVDDDPERGEAHALALWPRGARLSGGPREGPRR